MSEDSKIVAEKPDLVSLILQTTFAILVLHISLVCVFDILQCDFHVEVKYPLIIDQLLWGIFFLPFIGFALMFVKNYYWKALGAFAFIVSVWEIYSFLERTAGAL